MNHLKKTYDRIAPWYDVLDWFFEWGRYRKVRPSVFEVVGDKALLLDCGAGTGRNVPYYPQDASVISFDLSARMLSRARQRARPIRPDVSFVQADVRTLPFPGDHFPAATATFLFCVLPPEAQTPALLELRRVVQPGGRIVLLDYTLSENPWRRRIMRLWAPWVRFAYGASFDRDPEGHALEAGLSVEDSEFVYADILRRLVLRVPG